MLGEAYTKAKAGWPGDVGESVFQFTATGRASLGRAITEVLTSDAETLLGETLQHLGISLRRRSPVNYGGQPEPQCGRGHRL